MADITIDQLATLTFYQIPEIFFTRIQHNENGYVKLTSSYTGLSSDAKLAYGALYNRCKLSISSFQKGNRDYVDENGAVFLIFTTKKERDFLALSGYMIFNFSLSQNSRHLGKIFLFNVDNSQLSKSHIPTDNQGFAGWG